jgi:sugar lactone lactonase YvrE
MKKYWLPFLAMGLFLFGSVRAQEPIPFTAENWDMFGGKSAEIGGRQAYGGLALLKGVQFRNGTLEWDIWVTGGRSYAGVVFHQQPTRDYEEFYVRPHKGNGLNADALQYTPVYHGVSCWQLYHGSGYTSPAVIPLNQWIHFKLDINGTRALATMNGTPVTTMQINRLEQGEISGRIGVKGPADGSAWFSNFRYSAGTPELPAAPIESTPVPGIIRGWEISEPMVNSETDPYEYYITKPNLTWKPLQSDPSGLVNLERAVVRNPMQPGWLYARTKVRAIKDGIHRFHLGYSDYVTVFINGIPVLNSTNAYLSRDPGFQGLIGFFDELMLPLKQGDNEITLLIGEEFGGWGFMMRDGEAVAMDPALKLKWELKHKLNYPESAVFDPSSGMVYVSNFMVGASEFISQVTTDGKIINREWVSGLSRPTGLCIAGGRLYAVERTGVAEIDIQNGTVLRRIPLEGCVFPNDITAAPDGTLYVSDNETNRIYQVKNGLSSVWMEGGEIRKPNGLHVDGNRLLVGCSGDPALNAIDLKTKQVTVLANLYPGAIMDGIQPVGNGRILFSDFNGHLFLLEKTGTYREILNTTSIQVNLADFEWIPEKELLIIPGLYSNRLRSYHIDLK